MSDNCDIRLQLSGAILTDCERRARMFCQPYPAGDGSYQTYDCVQVPQDDTLRIEEVALTVAVNSFIAGKQLAIVQPYLGQIGVALARVPAEATLQAPDETVPWCALHDLFASFPDQDFKVARMTKILHKKRPALIPMLDNVLIDEYFSRHQDYQERVRCLPEDEKCVELMKLFRLELLANLPGLGIVQHSLASGGIHVTPVRLLELLMWNWFNPRRRF